MQNNKFFSMLAPLRITMILVSGLILLSGCGSDEKKQDDEKDEKKPAYERVVILKQRFTQLENSLDEMERDLQIQQKRIDNTRETAKSIKRSLLKGSLKGYSIDTISSDPLVLQAMEKRQEKALEKEAAEEEKDESDDLILNTLLIILFIIFIIVIFAVALKDRKQTPHDSINKPAQPEPGPAANSSAEDSSDVMDSGSSYTYGELRSEKPSGEPPSLKDELMPPSADESGDEEPRQ